MKCLGHQHKDRSITVRDSLLGDIVSKTQSVDEHTASRTHVVNHYIETKSH